MATEKKGFIVGKVKRGKERWKKVGVYVSKGEMERVLKELKEWIGNRKQGGRTIVGGD